MLTNNKKNFVRSIAVLLVMLMVFAMGLTACGDSVTKEDVETTVADKLTAALADYIRKDDEATVKAIVEKVLADGNITAAKLEELTNALDGYVKTADLEGLVKKVIVDMELDKALDKDGVLEILKDYYSKDEIDNMMEDYFGEFDAEEVYKILSDAEKAMNRDEWDDATDIVIATIEYAQTLIEKLYSETYLQSRMQDVNTALADYELAAFTAVQATSGSNTYTFYENTDRATFTKYVEYMILRQPTVEAMEELKDALDAAFAVKTFEDEQKALTARLLALGEKVGYGTYEGTTFKNPNNNLTQVVTLHDKDAFYAWEKDLDDMLVAYTTDKKSLTEMTVEPAAYGLTVRNVYTQSTSAGIDVAIDPAVTTGWTLAGATVAADNDFVYNKFNDKDFVLATYEDDDQVLTAEIPVFSYILADMLADEAGYSVETDWRNTGKYGYETGDELNNKVYSSKSTAMAAQSLTAKLDYMKCAKDYNAIVAQLTECQIAANDANEMFKAFQHDIIFANTTGMAAFQDWPDKLTITYTPATGTYGAGLVNALTISMCEPGGKYAHPSATYGGAPVYLTDIEYKYFSVTEEMEQTCALNNNGKDAPEIGVDEYDLYKAMMSRAYDLLWEKYRMLALEWADKMLMDYISVTYEAQYYSSYKTGDHKTATLTYATIADDEDAWIDMLVSNGEWADDNVVSEGFINAFYNGAAIPDETEEINIYKLLGHTFENAGLNKFYINNGTAKYAYVASGAVATGNWFANPIATIAVSDEDIRDLLADSMRNVDAAINGAVLADKKNSGVPVQKAFHEYLKAGIANLEEIYDRFLIEDYAIMKYNDLAVVAADIEAFYNAQGETKLLYAVDGYLFGTDRSGAFWGNVTKDSNNKVTAISNGKDVTFTSDVIYDQLTRAMKNYKFGLKSGAFVTKVDPETVLNPYAQSVDGTTPKIAAAKMATIDQYYEEAKADVENMIIKVNFLTYIDIARGNLDDAAVAYWAAVRANDKDDTKRLGALNYAKGNSELAIVNIKYYADRDEFALNTYKAEYLNLLSIVAGKDVNDEINPHLALFNAEATIEEIIADSKLAASTMDVAVFNAKLAEIVSYDHMANCTAPTQVSGWTLPYATTADYEFVGSAVVELDTSVNNDEFATCVCPTGCEAAHH